MSSDDVKTFAGAICASVELQADLNSGSVVQLTEGVGLPWGELGLAEVDCAEDGEGDGRDDVREFVVILVVGRDDHCASIMFERDGGYLRFELDGVWFTTANILGHAICNLMGAATEKCS